MYGVQSSGRTLGSDEKPMAGFQAWFDEADRGGGAGGALPAVPPALAPRGSKRSTAPRAWGFDSPVLKEYVYVCMYIYIYIYIRTHIFTSCYVHICPTCVPSFRGFGGSSGRLALSAAGFLPDLTLESTFWGIPGPPCLYSLFVTQRVQVPNI